MYVDARGWTSRVTYPNSNEEIIDTEAVQADTIWQEIQKNDGFELEGYKFAKRFFEKYREFYD